MFNHSNVPFKVKRFDRIAQLILEKIIYGEIEIMSDNLPETKRGSNSFGSSGM